MLLLFRKVGETFFVETPGGRIQITIVALYQNGVRVGIKAPKEYNIYREELLAELKQARDSASSGEVENQELTVEHKSPLIQRLASKLKFQGGYEDEKK